MKLGYSKSQFEIPEGQYVASFKGIEMLEPKPSQAPLLGRDGNPMPPGMAWRFTIEEGPERGKQADRVTGRNPTPKNLCGRFLVAISGQILKDGVEVDLAAFSGKRYRINVVQKDNSDGTCVSDQGIVPLGAATSQPAPTGAASGPPPRRKAIEEKFYVVTNPDAEPVEMDRPTAQSWIETNGKKANEVELCKVGDTDYVTADKYQFSGAAF